MLLLVISVFELIFFLSYLLLGVFHWLVLLLETKAYAFLCMLIKCLTTEPQPLPSLKSLILRSGLSKLL